MGDYVYLRGKAQIKPEYVQAVKPRFTSDESKYLDWIDLMALPEEILLLKDYAVLANPEMRGMSYPGSWGSALPGFTSGTASQSHITDWLEDLVITDAKDQPLPFLGFDDEGRLSFSCSSKMDETWRAFINVIRALSSSYYILVDDRECAMEPWSAKIRVFRRE